VLPSGADIATSGTVDVTMHMDAGDVAMTLDRVGAPCAVNSFESLAKQGYFDDTSCHRLVPGFVLQCGDPTGTGSGGPGYSFADELSGKETYPYGTVAMANAGPDTNGSQFFIVIGDDAQGLPASYDVLGTVDAASMAVIESIAAQGVDSADAQGIRPAEGGHISSVTAS
jgi:peptidyl-prolyl cis-trans isomerase B (cyclophilin B)